MKKQLISFDHTQMNCVTKRSNYDLQNWEDWDGIEYKKTGCRVTISSFLSQGTIEALNGVHQLVFYRFGWRFKINEYKYPLDTQSYRYGTFSLF